MKKLLLLLVAVVLVYSCMEDDEVSLYPQFDISKTKHVTENNFDEYFSISADTIITTIEERLEEGDEVRRVFLESIYVGTKPSKDNKATGAILDVYIMNNTGVYLPVASDFSTTINVNETYEDTLLLGLDVVGVDELKRQLNAVIQRTSYEDISFRVTGVAVPQENNVDLDLSVIVYYAVEYVTTID